MEMQAEAERKKRAQILESEGNQFDIPILHMDDIPKSFFSFITYVNSTLLLLWLWALLTCIVVKQEKGRRT